MPLRMSGLPVSPLQINPHSPHAVGLVGLWNTWSNRAGATWDDLSGRGNSGTVTLIGADAAYFPVLRPGGVGRALRFAGYAAGPKLGVVALSSLFSTLPMSVAVWFRPESAKVNNVLFWTGVTGGWTGHYLNAGSGGVLQTVTANSASFAVSGGVAYAANQWQHAIGVWESATYRRAYLNGRGDTADTTSKTPSSFEITRFGAAFDSSTTGLLGSIAEVRIYRRVLQPSEIMSMYHPATRWDLYSQPRRYYYAQSAAGFQAAWARNSNTVIQAGK